MNHRRGLRAGLCVAALSVAGCSSSPPSRPTSIPPPFSGVLAATCVVPIPPTRAQVSGPVSGAASNGRFTRTISLDKANLTLSAPPTTAKPAISARLAECNLRASKTAEGAPVGEETQLTGLTFGLATVSVRDSLLTAPPLFTVTGPNLPAPPALHGYHQRLSWVAIVRPELKFNCPSVPNSPSPSPSPTPEVAQLPGYQVLVIDANTGGDGFVYAASRNQGCSPGIQQPSLSSAVEEASVPWTLVARNADGYSADINVSARSCDGAGDGNGAFNVSRDVPGFVTTTIERPLNACGPARPQHRTLQASTVSATLPAHLTHGPLGAVDMVPQG